MENATSLQRADDNSMNAQSPRPRREALAPRERGEGGARASGRVRGLPTTNDEARSTSGRQPLTPALSPQAGRGGPFIYGPSNPIFCCVGTSSMTQHDRGELS